MYTNSGGKQMIMPPYGAPAAAAQPFMVDRGRWRPAVELAPNCPRCDSSNTKFCYYNNYSLTQPRYFCKGCRRYWTKGGSLRNVPVGGGCRKNRRSSSNKSLRSTSAPAEQAQPPGCGVSARPDLALDDMIWSSGSSEEVSSSDGSSIDLAQLYEKFLNNWSDQETGCVPANQCSSIAEMNPIFDMGEHHFSLEHDFQIPLQLQEYQNITSAATMDGWSDHQHQQPLMESWGSSLDHELTSMNANPDGVVLDYQHPLTFTGEDHQELVIDHETFPSSSCSLPSNNIDQCQGFGSCVGQYDHQQVFGEWSISDDQPSFEAFYGL